MVKISEILFFDFDDTTAKSNKRFGELYNEDYKNYPNFKKANGELEYKWGFTTQCPLLQKDDLHKYFNSKRFFEGLELYEGAKEAIERLSKKYTIKIPSMGWTDNLIYKGEFITQNFGDSVEFIPINFNDVSDKGGIDMSNGIHVDDNSKYLFSSNAKVKIAFGEVYDWNRDWTGKRFYEWSDLEKYLIDRYFGEVD